MIGKAEVHGHRNLEGLTAVQQLVIWVVRKVRICNREDLTGSPFKESTQSLEASALACFQMKQWHVVQEDCRHFLAQALPRAEAVLSQAEFALGMV